MKIPCGLKTTDRCLDRFVIARILAGMVLLAFASLAHAKIVHTAVNVTVSGSGSIVLELTQDKTKELKIQAALGTLKICCQCDPTGCVCGRWFPMAVTETPVLAGTGVIAKGIAAAKLSEGDSIDASQSFTAVQELLTSFAVGGPACRAERQGDWCASGGDCKGDGYLGLEFEIEGSIHYGWAHIIITESEGTLTTTLKGFAYETDPGQPIKAGQTSGD